MLGATRPCSNETCTRIPGFPEPHTTLTHKQQPGASSAPRINKNTETCTKTYAIRQQHKTSDLMPSAWWKVEHKGRDQRILTWQQMMVRLIKARDLRRLDLHTMTFQSPTRVLAERTSEYWGIFLTVLQHLTVLHNDAPCSASKSHSELDLPLISTAETMQAQKKNEAVAPCKQQALIVSEAVKQVPRVNTGCAYRLIAAIVRHTRPWLQLPDSPAS